MDPVLRPKTHLGHATFHTKIQTNCILPLSRVFLSAHLFYAPAHTEGVWKAAREKMKTILSSETMELPDGVNIKVKAKVIEVEGPRGKLTRDFKHLNLDFQLITDEETGKRKLKVDAWFGSRKTTAAIRTALSHVNNLITGVTKGYRYKMRFVYAHFPINASITNGSKSIEIRNFLGEKKVRKVEMLDGVSILRSEKVKDELILDGNDIELVSRSCALINQVIHACIYIDGYVVAGG
ncbi:60S ribosomal L9-like [Olea europaea subsp. europaea]|uniref:60S ribosomal L9-like n=1 Tax=Olea europaea subsp. europaea TaxID=158383 RepID=A0A8S0T3T7_OLEEU|nr:60S ribosomal L9-like [Olea europaea subsp. europaea]